MSRHPWGLEEKRTNAIPNELHARPTPEALQTFCCLILSAAFSAQFYMEGNKDLRGKSTAMFHVGHMDRSWGWFWAHLANIQCDNSDSCTLHLCFAGERCIYTCFSHLFGERVKGRSEVGAQGCGPGLSTAFELCGCGKGNLTRVYTFLSFSNHPCAQK